MDIEQMKQQKEAEKTASDKGNTPPPHSVDKAPSHDTGDLNKEIDYLNTLSRVVQFFSMSATGRASGTSNLNSEFNQVYELIHNPPTAQVSDAMRDCAALIKTGCQRILESSDPQTHHSLDEQNLQKAQTLASMQTTKGAAVEADLQVLIELHKTAVKEKIAQLKLTHPGQDLSKLEAIEKDINQIGATDSNALEAKTAHVQTKAEEAEKEAQKKEQEEDARKQPEKSETAEYVLESVVRNTAAAAAVVMPPSIPPMETTEQTALSSFMDERYGHSPQRSAPLPPTHRNTGR